MESSLLKALGWGALGATSIGAVTYMNSKRKTKPILAALGTGVAAGIITGLMYRAGYFTGVSDQLEGKAQFSGLGLLDIKRMGRMGIYMPEPTVKKFSSFTGTKYYS